MALTGSFATPTTTCPHGGTSHYNAARRLHMCGPCARADEAASPFTICQACGGETADDHGSCADCQGTGQVLKPGHRQITVTVTDREAADLVDFAHNFGDLEPVFRVFVAMADEVRR